MPDRFAENATITARTDLTQDLTMIRVMPDFPLPAFVPGQYAELAIVEQVPDTQAPLGRLVRKAYSMASVPQDVRGLEFYITLVAAGDLTPKLWRLGEGARLWMNPRIKGKFTLDPVRPGADLLLFATGTGIAPYLSMLRTFAEHPPWHRVFVFHGVREAADLGYRAELESYAARSERMFYVPSVTREPQESTWCGLRGRMTDLLRNGAYEEHLRCRFSPENCQVMLCGNPEMVDETQQILEARGFRQHSKKHPGQIHVERYW